MPGIFITLLSFFGGKFFLKNVALYNKLVEVNRFDI